MLSCVRLCVTPWTVACQAPLSIGFSRQEYWSGLLFPPPGDLPHQGTELMSPALAGGFFTSSLSQRGSYGVAKSPTALSDWTWGWEHHKGLCCYFIVVSYAFDFCLDILIMYRHLMTPNNICLLKLMFPYFNLSLFCVIIILYSR